MFKVKPEIAGITDTMVITDQPAMNGAMARSTSLSHQESWSRAGALRSVRKAVANIAGPMAMIMTPIRVLIWLMSGSCPEAITVPTRNTKVAAKPAKASNIPRSAMASIRYQVGANTSPPFSITAVSANPIPAKGSSRVVEPSPARR